MEHRSPKLQFDKFIFDQVMAFLRHAPNVRRFAGGTPAHAAQSFE